MKEVVDDCHASLVLIHQTPVIIILVVNVLVVNMRMIAIMIKTIVVMIRTRSDLPVTNSDGPILIVGIITGRRHTGVKFTWEFENDFDDLGQTYQEPACRRW